jgi:tRNA(fMet)-specific endonuclease VapC
LAEVRRQTALDKQIRAYERLQRLFFRFANSKVLPFDRPAGDVYQDLIRQKLRVGSMDLKIAAIALSTDATLLSRNTVDFSRIAGLKLDDWLR